MGKKHSVIKNNNISLIGQVRYINGGYVFVSKQNEMFNISNLNDDIVKRLQISDEICLMEINSGDSVGVITEILGKDGDPIAEGRGIAKAHKLIKETSPEVMAQIEKIVAKRNYMPRYRDLTNVGFVTIDPEGAKDFDDAVYAKANKDGTFTLMVAIANTANYVEDKSPLFMHALERCLSSYLGKVVYPMQPETISNDICSLNEKTNKVVMCTTMKIDKLGNVLGYAVEPAIINSRHRLTYPEVDYIIDHNIDYDDAPNEFKGSVEKTADVRGSLEALFGVSEALAKNRNRRGAFDIQSRTPEFILDSTGTEVIAIRKEHQERSAEVIESTAIVCNECWGDLAQRLNIPFLYRNFEGIITESDKNNLIEALAKYGVFLDKNSSNYDIDKVEFNGRFIKKLIDKFTNSNKEEPVISTILRCLGNAYYSTNCKGHVGLGIEDSIKDDFGFLDEEKIEGLNTSEYIKYKQLYKQETGLNTGIKVNEPIMYKGYSHVTSPIRRLADMLNQIQLLEIINSGEIVYNKEQLQKYADVINKAERNAKSAEFEYRDMLSTIWAKQNIGNIVIGRVIGFHKEALTIMTDECIKVDIPYESIERCRVDKDTVKRFLNDMRMGVKAHRFGIDYGDVIVAEIERTTSKPFRIIAKENVKVSTDEKENY